MKENTLSGVPNVIEEKSPIMKSATGQDFKHLDLNTSINHLVYGTTAKVVKNNEKKPKSYVFTICEQNLGELHLINLKKDKTKKIGLEVISGVSSFMMAFKKKSRYNTAQMLKIHYQKDKDLVLLFKDNLTKEHFWNGLQYFIDRVVQLEAQGTDINSWLVNNLFTKNDHKGYRALNKKELKDMVKRLSLKTQPSLDELINEHNISKLDELDEKRYIKFFKHLLRKEEIYHIFEKYASFKANAEHKESMMSLQDLIRFFEVEQKQVLTLTELKLMNEIIPNAELQEPSVSFHIFSGLIFSPSNSIFNTAYLHEYQDLTRPLTDYYINSSHNTYLMSNQLTGVSSVQAYINALKRGCRCVELDLWDGPNKDPIIYHGHTMTSKIFFEDVIKGLKDHAFLVNPYPLILSFEMHCGLKGQKKIADILKKELGDMIYSIPADFEKYKYYPSPASLKYKFILKCKGRLLLSEDIDCDELGEYRESYAKNMRKVGESLGPITNAHPVFTATQAKSFADPITRESQGRTLTSVIGCKGDRDISVEYFDMDEKPSTRVSTKGIDKTPGSPVKNVVIESRPSPKAKENGYVSAASLRNSKDTREEKTKQLKANTLNHVPEHEIVPMKDKKKKKVHPELNLLYGLIGKKFNINDKFTSIWEICSIKEEKFDLMYKTMYKELIEYHKKVMTRIYPSNLRVYSSNYCPIKGWATGAQLVALNFQSDDEPMLLNYAKFRANGGSKCGYVMKPSFMLHDATQTALQIQHPNDIKIPLKRITIQIISAQALRSNLKSSINPFVEVKIRGLEFDEKNNQIYRTHTVHSNGFHPIWMQNGKLCKYSFKIAAPTFCTVVFGVYNEDFMGKYRIGWYAIDFQNMRQGYRVIPLLNNELRVIKHTYILCHIGITDVS